MATLVKKWGNSMAIRLPKAVADAAALREGTSVTIEARNGGVMVTPERKPAYRLESLVRKINSANRHKEAGTGNPRGREAW